ncbi:ribonucleoside-diphosphate reductase subunit alpha [Vibrio coralliirubri]|uniref:class 1a ribonucleoside-diphosphate reductase subunit alpha n=1 Tax=Vibrio coralliirubri TaxID=1516159 RepID=UPI0022845A24|nr:class 1a ribonucleoside-diphosphate reductase subunit alpha [Vibrio coralliirubri]MCY9861091.1 ribonucleoside-diphosphate reductase subunit alpha [Vibrio coralliirubri]
MATNVTKRNGNLQPINLDKIYRLVDWAAEGRNVSTSMIVLRAQLQFYEGIKTSEIHDILTKSAADLISVESPDYQYVAANMRMFALRKEAFGQFEPPRLYDHVQRLANFKQNGYDPELLKAYSKEEFDMMESFIDHSLDFTYAYAAVKQFEGKYLVQNRVTKQVYESPQFLYILAAATLHINESPKTRMKSIRRFYAQVATRRLSLPTPVMSGARTKTKQFSSCVKIESGDSLDSINATSSAIVRYVSQRAGIGINAGALRALGSEIRGGEALHTGCIPFYKYFQTAVKCCSQGGVRGGAATTFYPFWHREFESLIVLKNNRGIEDNRVRGMDYGVQLNGFIYERALKGEEISLFSPSDVPDLLNAFYADQKLFSELYVKYENDPTLQSQTIRIKALDLLSTVAQERASTGRIYIQNIDHCNTHSSFLEAVAPVKQSNLCMEITLPTAPLVNVDSEEGEVALCTLAAFNLGEISIDNLGELEETADVAVRALDNLLDYQDYPVAAAKKSLLRRALGVGVVNYAYFLAKNGVKYSDGSANNITHKLFEAIQYYLIKASVKLAKEKGRCEWFDQTKYSQGIFPIDTYKKAVDKLVTVDLEMDWDTLRKDVATYGMRNSTLSALMPSETSSQILNATNGIEPPRGHVSVKASKDGVLRQVVPDVETLQHSYELLWDIGSNTGYLHLVGIMQKFLDQAISANTNYDPERFENGRVPVKKILEDMMTAYKYGVKTLYYHNTRDNHKDDSTNTGEENPSAAVEVIETIDDLDCGGGCKI